MQSFIETQFPVSKLSKESYKERMGSSSQTLPRLGKWWGRKPLILVRATLLGLLLPASDNPRRDREIFLKLLTMDEEGLWQRKVKTIPLKDVYGLLNTRERNQWFTTDSSELKPKLKKGLSKVDKEAIQFLAFERLSYDEKLPYCCRPEHINGPSEPTWQEINAHLGTNATSLPNLVQELGKRNFDCIPTVGDAFCGGGSIPFEAARIGCNSYGSDLNPVAGLLSWSSLNIIGGKPEVIEEVNQALKEIYDAVDQRIIDWEIEHDKQGCRADNYLYCAEVVCPECSWSVPFAPSWIIGATSRCVAKLIPDETNKRFDIQIVSGVSSQELQEAKEAGTAGDSSLLCPHCKQSTPVTMLRGDRRLSDGTHYGLRKWENDDLMPRPTDVFQERLYCIRWVETYTDEKGEERTRRYYRAPDQDDVQREKIVLNLLKKRFPEWQIQGYLPTRKIEPGDETTRLNREKGWTYWHHLFTPRQLLYIGCLLAETDSKNLDGAILSAALLSAGRCADFNSRLSRWDSSIEHEHTVQTFSNQALNTLQNYSTQGFSAIRSYWEKSLENTPVAGNAVITASDARSIKRSCNLWVTDPPYADAINYHELGDFFLAWYEKLLKKLFPDWYTDSKRALAVVGRDEGFRKSMVDCYHNLAIHMPDNGYQVVMFTHQDAEVWADLALILWASGLCVTVAWCIVTETNSAQKQGNYVQGTVLLVLRKQTSDDTAFLDEIYPKVELEVKRQLASMLALEDEEDPNFGDTDYQLAAYAAALRVLTQYQNIEDIDIAYELSKPRSKSPSTSGRGARGEGKSEIEKIIDQAVVIACDYLVPKGFDTFVWKSLTPEERFYLKGLDIESHGEYRTGAYQELARGFGVKDYKPFLQSGKANQTRLKTATEFTTKTLGGLSEQTSGFSASLVRHALFAIRETVRTESTQQGKSWLRAEVRDYWNQRKNLIHIIRYLATMGFKMNHWSVDAKAAEILAGALENDSV